MISNIELIGFKQFSQFKITCRKNNILVGPNNSGKSTILDALRILNDVLRYARRRVSVLKSQGEFGACSTFILDHTNISVPLQNVCTNYQDVNAVICVSHTNGSELRIHLHPEKHVEAFLRYDGRQPRSIAMFRKAFPLDVVVVPTLGPLEETERYVLDETVSRNENTRLASRNFRNIWLRKDADSFSALSDLLAETWRGISLHQPEVVRGPESFLQMFYEENRILREVFWSGFGFQVWLQMITQIMRGTPGSVLVLDEPDIYLHSDLQRKLLRLVKEKFGQSFIATHSTEIINESNPGDILSISNSLRTARRITTEEGYRDIFAYIGSSENAEFARVSRARRIVFFEGNDRRILRRFARKAGAGAILEDTDTVFLQAGGFGQWRRVKEVNWTLENMFGMDVKIACVFDRDYRCDEEIDQFIDQMSSEAIKCHVLGRKEIENYGLERTTLVRAARRKILERQASVDDAELDGLIDSILERMREDVRAKRVASYLSFLQTKKTGRDQSTILREAMAQFDELWSIPRKRFELVPGKEFLSIFSAELQARYRASLSLAQLIGEMRRDEISEDLVDVISDISLFFSE